MLGSNKVGVRRGSWRRPDRITATSDVDALIELAPDCVNYMPRVMTTNWSAGCCAGHHVVTTGDFLTGSTTAERRASRKRRKGSATPRTGFEPGFINVVAGS